MNQINKNLIFKRVQITLACVPVSESDLINYVFLAKQYNLQLLQITSSAQ